MWLGRVAEPGVEGSLGLHQWVGEGVAPTFFELKPSEIRQFAVSSTQRVLRRRIVRLGQGRQGRRAPSGGTSPAHDLERVEAVDRVGGAFGEDVADPGGAVRGHERGVLTRTPFLRQLRSEKRNGVGTRTHTALGTQPPRQRHKSYF